MLLFCVLRKSRRRLGVGGALEVGGALKVGGALEVFGWGVAQVSLEEVYPFKAVALLNPVWVLNQSKQVLFS